MLALAALIPLFPLLAFAAIAFGLWRSRRGSAWAAIGAMGLSTLLALGLFPAILGQTEMHRPFQLNVPWIPFGAGEIAFGVLLDPMTAVMLLTVTLVCTLIFIYSQGYMAADPHYARFFAYVSLFATGMLGVVVSSNLLMFFVFWEIMGLCSYLLISFWHEKPEAARAGLKAFIVTRLGDLSLLLGLVLLFARTGSLLFTENFEAVRGLAATDPNFVTLVALLIFGGAVGKSAQFPLHVWLPDAMEGPTPVSALIHAATMVAAGVYLLARNFPILEAAVGREPNVALTVVGYIGAFSALFAATMALAQSDIKRVLAYSTISQLGYMVLAVGVGSPAAAIFHLMTHAFFKALMFLAAGSVIHAMLTNDMFRMGGLRKEMPTTYWTMGVGALALAGIFPFAGFWSKDEILAASLRQDPVLWFAAALAALLTGLYTARLMGLTFFGELRDKKAHPHESPPVMLWPLRVLAVFAALVGLLVGLLPLFGGPALAELLEPGVEHHGLDLAVAGVSLFIALAGLGLGYLFYIREPLKAGKPDPLRRRMGGAFGLLERKYYVDEFYDRVFVRPAYALAGWVYNFDDRWVIDPIVEGAGRVTERLGFGSSRFDRSVVDGAANLTADVTRESGEVLRGLQSGRVQNYMLILILGLLVLVAAPYLPPVAFWLLAAFVLTVLLVAILDHLLRARRAEG